ncbi:Uncharacterised protein [Serratia quinivorans]|nr:Uncharacterised protein [Serratia quinivorans]CAI1050279.1 Uncharacterised protein [Serratia quinivorans]CAI1195990.1 Uncharacterised protein [Serratia quinivorans]CAI1861638.1 Uncharacterised protein [Serratia quinivorans]CAI2110778.1 Uncharacterised protein [Serratia quinivorans]
MAVTVQITVVAAEDAILAVMQQQVLARLSTGPLVD